MPITALPGGMRSARPCRRKNGARALTPTTRSQSARPTVVERPRSTTPGAVDEHVDPRAGLADGRDRRLDIEQIGRHVRARLRLAGGDDVDRHDLEAVAGEPLDARAPDAPEPPVTTATAMPFPS